MFLVPDSIDLSDYVRSKMADLHLSTYDVAKRSGNKISAATITKIINREVKSNGIHTLDALAEGLGVPKDEVYNVVRGLPATPSRFEIYAETFDANELTEDEWRLLEKYFAQQVMQYKSLKSAVVNSEPREKEESKNPVRKRSRKAGK